ncbi:MAG: serine/threonine protein kinase [Planctomycetaceae bacterium]|nr:MAG: serine/threonine protein kinase [Planctomycetaceae bacterium]
MQSSTPSPTSQPTGQEAFDLTGRTLGEFKILRKLGRGGMAEVYLAEQTSLSRQVAIKVLKPEFVSDETYVKRFKHEARAAGGLNHPNIVQVYHIGEQDGFHYIAQEYVRGSTLRDYMRKKGQLELGVALHILRQVTAALHVAGQAGIVHRDIKPENILLTRRGEAKVADFGLAQLTQGGDRVALTQVGVTMGTPLYMSPEQAAGKSVDHRSDLYSLGAMAYHMLAGHPPFQGDNAVSVAVQHINEKPKPLKQLRPDLPDAVCNMVHKLLAKRREDRHPDALTLLGEIKALQKEYVQRASDSADAVYALDTAEGSYSRRPLWQRPWRQQLPWLLAMGLLVMFAAGGIGWAMRVGDPFVTPAPPEPTVEKQDTIEAQYFLAMCRGNDESAWLAVVNYEPREVGTERLERKLAWLRLATLYLQQHRWAEAEHIFDQFLREGVSDPWKKLHGLAGRAILKSLRGDTRGSNQDIDAVDRMADAVKIDAKLKILLDEARERNDLRQSSQPTSTSRPE